MRPQCAQKYLKNAPVSFEAQLKCAIRSAVVIKHFCHTVAQKNDGRCLWRIFADFTDVRRASEPGSFVVDILEKS